MTPRIWLGRFLFAGILAFMLSATAYAEKKYDSGASDEVIKIGSTAPLSGPGSAFGQISRAAAAYFKKVNDEGGVNGRKIEFVVADDGYSPPRTIEQTRRLVEGEQVLAMFGMVGSATNGAVHKYLNAKKVPHLFIGSTSTKWDNPKAFPWSVGWMPNGIIETAAYTAFIDESHPNAKIGVLYQDDEFGKDYVKGLQQALGDRYKQRVISEQSYVTTDSTVDTQIISLKSSGADIVYLFATPKFAAQAIRKIYDIDWKPTILVSNVSASVGAVLTHAGLEKSVGVISSRYLKDATGPGIESDEGYIEWAAFMDKYMPDGNKTDYLNVYGYTIAQNLVYVLEKAGDNLTRENVLLQATTMKDVRLPMLVEGLLINNSKESYSPVRKLQLIRFDGEQFVPFSDFVGN